MNLIELSIEDLHERLIDLNNKSMIAPLQARNAILLEMIRIKKEIEKR